MDDDNSMCERILRSIETIFHTDPELKEFTIVPTEINTKNKSPVLYEEHAIGLESWCVKHVYRYAYLELFEQRKLFSKNKLPFTKEQNLNHLLMGVLLINPDVSTFWNMKRELVQKEILMINQELLFTKIVLSHKSKSNEAFSYRRWLCKRVLSKVHVNDSQIIENLLLNELQVSELAANKSQNNYHAWTHRIWVMETFCNRSSNVSNLFLLELDFSYRWISLHVSEHTCYHYRQYLIDTVKKNNNVTSVFNNYFNHVIRFLGLVDEHDTRNILKFLLNKQKFQGKSIEELNRLLNHICILLFDLFDTLEALNNVFPNHETIWYYRRYLLYSLIKSSYECHDLPFKNQSNVITDFGNREGNIVDFEYSMFYDGEKLPKLLKSLSNNIENCYLYQTLVKHESEFVKKNLQSQSELTKRHEKWLKFIICLEGF